MCFDCTYVCALWTCHHAHGVHKTALGPLERGFSDGCEPPCPAPIYIDAKDAMNVFSSVWAFFFCFFLMKSGHSVSVQRAVDDRSWSAAQTVPDVCRI